MARITKAEALHGVDPRGKATKIANNTWRYCRASDGATVYRLHRTDIVQRMPDGRLILNSGGWQTVTTKDRLNSCMGDYAVFSEKGHWYVCRRGDWAKRVCYFDGITLPHDLDNPPSHAMPNDALANSIKRFVRQIDKLDKLPQPDGGDCWLCMARQTSCLQSHLDENYLHGSLLVAAMRWAGYKDAGIYLHLTGHPPHTSVKSALRRYLRRHLRLPA